MKTGLILCAGLLAMAVHLPLATAGAIYKWKDEKGVVHIGDRPPASSTAEQISVRVNTYTTTAVPGRESAAPVAGEKVVIYTTRRCGYCKKAKAWFKRKGVPYTEYDVETSTKGKRDYQKLDGRGVPIILVGEKRLNGFSEGQLAAALKKAGYTL